MATKTNSRQKLNIVIPAYNETGRLPETLNQLSDFLSDSELSSRYDIASYIVNDGSRDQTQELAEKLMEKFDLKGEVMSYQENKGKGYAVKFGMLHSREADFYYLADSDLASSWYTLNELVQVAEANNTDCVIGSRAVNSSEVDTVASRQISGRISNKLINLFLNLGIKDTQCGYKLFKKTCLPAFEKQKLNRFGFDFEILYLIKKMGLKIEEVGISWENKTGSKVKPSDYLNTFRELIKVRFINNYGKI
jgi:dolichyl-phosphate beta-glucosyltransferase